MKAAPAQFQPANLGLCTTALALATFMQVLDTTIANVSLPTIAGNLGVSTDQSTWVITAFAVSNAIALPLTGWLTRRFGEVRLFVMATLLFTIASFLCGVAFSMGSLVGFRALQGFVAGPMYPITQALLISIYPPTKRSQALALLATVTVVAPIAGPILGGWITDNYSWPWIFFINVPIGIFSSFTVWRLMRHKPATLEKPRMDYVGLITLVIGVGALQLVLDKGNEEDWFNSNFIVATAIVSAIALAIFLIWELTDKEPIVNLKLFRHRNFSAGTLTLMLAYGGFFSIGLLVPQWLQTQLHYTAVWSGLASAPIGLLPVLLTPFVGKYAAKFDMRMLASTAFLVMGLASFYRSGFTANIDFARVAWVQSGFVNAVLTSVGLPAIGWHANSLASHFAIATMVNFRWTGYNTLIVLAAMQAIPRDIIEAAVVDGASRVRTFFSVTVPMLRPTLIFVIITSTIGGLQIFDEPRMFDTSGGGGADRLDRHIRCRWTANENGDPHGDRHDGHGGGQNQFAV